MRQRCEQNIPSPGVLESKVWLNGLAAGASKSLPAKEADGLKGLEGLNQGSDWVRALLQEHYCVDDQKVFPRLGCARGGGQTGCSGCGV